MHFISDGVLNKKISGTVGSQYQCLRRGTEAILDLAETGSPTGVCDVKIERLLLSREKRAAALVVRGVTVHQKQELVDTIVI